MKWNIFKCKDKKKNKFKQYYLMIKIYIFKSQPNQNLCFEKISNYEKCYGILQERNKKYEIIKVELRDEL